MAAKTKDMTQGAPLGLILGFALPLMIGNIFQQLYTVVDTMIVGQILGVTALAAVGAADWTNWMMLGIIQGFTQGFSIRIAQDFGAGHVKKIRKDITSCVFLAAVLAVVLLIIGQCLVLPLLHVMQTPDGVIDGATLYLRIMFAGIPIVMAYNMLASILRAFGDGRSPLYAMMIACMVNIVLDIVFVAFWNMGIAGAAIATLIAQFSSAIYCFFALKKVGAVKLERSDWRADKALCLDLMKLGFPMAFQNAIIAVGGMIVQSVVNGFGVLFIAGFTATNKLYGILEVAATSYGYAMVTYTGQNLGAGKTDRVKKGVRMAVLAAVFTSAVISICMILFGKNILGLFISGTPEEMDMTLEIAYRYLSIMSYCLFILYFLHIYRSVLQGLGDTMLPMASGIAEFIMRTGAAVLLPVLMGAEGIFYAEILAWLGADVILISAYYVKVRKIEEAGKRITTQD